jgi:3-hydroxybutyryl-CoA dehydrogenase
VVLQKESLGFIGNRMQFALLREAISIVENGIASAEDVDLVVKNSFGRRLSVAGPFEVFDLAGWDTIAAIIDQLFPALESSTETPALVRDILARGELGVKSGKGFYPWSDEAVAGFRQRISRALASIEQASRDL